MSFFWALFNFVFLPTAHADLRPGDLLLQSQACFLCALIEIEEGLPYSHVGVVVQDSNGTFSVLEAWNKVQRTPLAEFLSRRRKGTQTLAIRPKYRGSLAQDPRKLNQWIQLRFQLNFAGHSYDPEFLWNNADGNGQTYYCSELVAKLLNPGLMRTFEPKPMHFQKNREYWIKYFNGNPPDGQLGLSPPDIARQY